MGEAMTLGMNLSLTAGYVAGGMAFTALVRWLYVETPDGGKTLRLDWSFLSVMVILFWLPLAVLLGAALCIEGVGPLIQATKALWTRTMQAFQDTAR
jgi:hypothetical protein